jgi:molybdopterin-containing oxidoreductase family membrane subunit
MFERALAGGRKYWTWITLLIVIMLVGFVSYMRQLSYGLGITGMGRDVSWGLYIANFTFLVGVAASAVIFLRTTSRSAGEN